MLGSGVSRSNLEAAARAIAEQICLRNPRAGEDVPAWVDGHWHCVAAELEAGLLDDNGLPLPGYTVEKAILAVLDWRRRNPR
jgi:hypothetical protein